MPGRQRLADRTTFVLKKRHSYMKNTLYLLFPLLMNTPLFSQNEPDTPALPYRQIPAYPEQYSAANVAARMIDGLGFRFYWATEGLRPEDLAFRPTPEARSSEETIDHILGLSTIVLNALKNAPNVRSGEEISSLAFAVKRRKILENLREASELLKNSDGDLDKFPIIRQSGDTRLEFPFWNLLNGPIADALWHTGQVVTFRRSSGNPIDPRVDVFMGRLRE